MPGYQMLRVIVVSVLFVSCAFVINAQTADSLRATAQTEQKNFPVTAEKVVENYVTAIGGKDNLQRVKDRITKMSAAYNGMSMSVTISQKAPGKYIAKISSGVLEQILVYDGVKGESRSPFGNETIEGAALTRLQFQADMTAITRLRELAITPVITDIQKVGARDCYKVDFLFSSGGAFTAYYDTVSFLKLREESPMHTPQGDFVQITDFRDFKTISGVEYPFTLIQSIGNKSVTLKVDSIEINTGVEDSLFQ